MNTKDELSEESRELLKGKNIQVKFGNDKDKYSKKRYAYVYKSYDLAENMYVVRTYIQKRYNLDRHILEILLKLQGMKIFTRAMYSDLPKSFTYSRWSSILESGYISLIMDDEDTDKRIYTLSTRGRNIVVKFYEYLSGEKKIPENSALNPMANKNKAIPFDKKKMDLIKKMNKLETPEHSKFLYK
ncbi:hypothetical protein [Tenacibaculum sp. 190524A02b]|uniref:hypothetical protein n=1 Tax=Tenacibaculum vairaonense TaxID=3137860 RepID=UPI0031FB97F5